MLKDNEVVTVQCEEGSFGPLRGPQDDGSCGSAPLGFARNRRGKKVTSRQECKKCEKSVKNGPVCTLLPSLLMHNLWQKLGS